MFKSITLLALYAFLYQGFITAFTKAATFSLPASPQTLAISLFGCTLFFLRISFSRFRISDILFFLIALGFILTKAVMSELSRTDIDYSLVFWYSMYAFLFVALRTSNPLKSSEITNAIYWFGLVSALVALAQFFGSESLPVYFVEPPFTREELLTTIYSYDLIDTVMNRPNGLFSNPIVYATFLVVVYEVSLLRLRKRHSALTYFSIFLVSFIIFASLSRAAIFGIIFVSFAYIFRSKRIFFVAAFFLSALFIYVQISDSNTLVFELLSRVNERFAGVDAFARASNAEHLSDKEKALEYIWNSPLLGYAIGSFASEDIITDGALFVLALEFGIPLTVLLYTFIILRIQGISHDPSCMKDFPVYSIYFFLISSVINSSLVDKAIVPILIILLTVKFQPPTLRRVTRAYSTGPTAPLKQCYKPTTEQLQPKTVFLA